jgi:hypothetical protein
MPYSIPFHISGHLHMLSEQAKQIPLPNSNYAKFPCLLFNLKSFSFLFLLFYFEATANGKSKVL